MPVMANAQKFYTSSDIEVGWKYWNSETSWNYLISNGKKVTLSCLPQIQSSGLNLSSPTEICTTFLLNNKFIVITFSESEGIRLSTAGAAITFSSLYSIMAYVSSQLWFEIDFGNIVYDPIFNRIMIPCGVDNSGNYNAICVDFVNSSSSVKSIKSDEKEFDESNVKYYNLQGIKVDVENAKGSILIKSDGHNSVKFYNK